MPGFIARADIEVDASPERVWVTLTRHASDVSLGAVIHSDWTVGSSVVWRGEWEGRSFEDEGVVLEAIAPLRLVLTHSSGGAGEGAASGIVHRLGYELSGRGAGTHLEFWQDGNATPRTAAEAERNWRAHLVAVKDHAER